MKQVTIASYDVEDAKGKKEILRIRLSDGTEGTTMQASFKEIVGQELYIQIKTKRTAKGDTITFSRVSVSDWLKNKDALDEKLEASGKHPGQYFYQELLDNPNKPPRFRERVVLRERYKDEFDAIWAKQAKEHTVLRDPAVRDTVLAALIPNNLELRQQWADKDLGTIVRDYVIYYQRPLKSQAKSKGQCRFERKHVAAVSSPVYQLFRIWQQVNNIVLRDKYMKEEPLSPEQRAEVVELLLQQGTLTEAGLLRALKLSKSGKETNLRAELPGHVTLTKLRKVLGACLLAAARSRGAATQRHGGHPALQTLACVVCRTQARAPEDNRSETARTDRRTGRGPIQDPLRAQARCGLRAGCGSHHPTHGLRRRMEP
ncbi:MAG: hypothetical protein IPJ85_13335 [Flavobacteriales bacterium]|nr:hypothetical protein [Flavobacteriales bacterium]